MYIVETCWNKELLWEQDCIKNPSEHMAAHYFALVQYMLPRVCDAAMARPARFKSCVADQTKCAVIELCQLHVRFQVE